ncbi:OmpA family protein [Methylosoma difficile]
MLKRSLLTVATLTSVGLLPLAHAADQPVDNRWYISPFGTFIKTDNDRQADDGWGGGLGVGKMINRYLNLEVRGFYNSLDGDNSATSDREWTLAGGTLDLQYYFSRQKLAPYAVVAVGGMDTRLNKINSIGFLAEGGLGLTYEVSNNFLLRSDVRYRYNNNEDHVQSGTTEFDDMVVNVGFVIPFGAKPTYVAQTETPVAAAPVAAAPDCSTLDDDNDGVNNCVDQCPVTPANSTVDRSGCPVKLILKGEHFNFDSAELTLNAKELLDGVAQSLANYPQKNDIEVQGHTSSEGSNAYNMKLSQRRAASVVEYLKAKGVENRLTATGFGEDHPIADNDTEAGKSENRRVELIWIEN